MNQVTVKRQESGDQGTFGKLYIINTEKWYYSIELPWINNQSRISCVPNAEWNIDNGYCLPEGEYNVIMRRSPKFGWTYWLSDVPMRSFCLIHPANYGGNVSKGYKTHVEGCIGLGYNLGWLEGQKAILRSRPAVLNFMSIMNKEPFKLKIINAF